MPVTTVQSGLYRFFSRGQLDAERLRYIAEVQKSNTQLAGASINGQSYQFNIQGRELTLEEWADAIAGAYCQLGITDYGTPSGNAALARF
jgi:hypothetical protein